MVFSFRKKKGKGSTSGNGLVEPAMDQANSKSKLPGEKKTYEEMDDDDRSYDFVDEESHKPQRLATITVSPPGNAATLPPQPPTVIPDTPSSSNKRNNNLLHHQTPPKTPNKTPSRTRKGSSGLFNRFRSSSQKQKLEDTDLDETAVITPTPPKRSSRTPQSSKRGIRLDSPPPTQQELNDQDENTPPGVLTLTYSSTNHVRPPSLTGAPDPESLLGDRGASAPADDNESVEILTAEVIRQRRQHEEKGDQDSKTAADEAIDSLDSIIAMNQKEEIAKQQPPRQPSPSRLNSGGDISVVDELLEEDVDEDDVSVSRQMKEQELKRAEERTRRMRMEREHQRRQTEKPPVVHDDNYIPGVPIVVGQSLEQQHQQQQQHRKKTVPPTSPPSPRYSVQNSTPKASSYRPPRTRDELRSVRTDMSSAFGDGDTYTSNETNFATEFRNALDDTVQRVIDAFRCSQGGRTLSAREILQNPTGVMRLFYDNLCTAQDFRNSPERPFYNEEFCRKWLEKMTTGIADYRSRRSRLRGMEMLYLQAPNSPGNEDPNWKGRSVRVVIATGSTGSLLDIQPKLEWSTAAGGRSSHIVTTSVPLLRIHSILTSADSDTIVDEDDSNNHNSSNSLGVESCFLTITSESGDIHMFEANTVEERDEMVNGLRNVIARLSFHLITGDATASVELYKDDEGLEDGDLPSLPNPRLNMNRIAHAMLD